MHLDKFSNPIFTEQDIFDALYKGFKITSDDVIFVEESDALSQLSQVSGKYFFSPIINPTLTVEDLDKAYQESWNMPSEYRELDIGKWLLDSCPEENYQRLAEELEAFIARDMLDLLRWLKYFVDTCSKEGIVWGVGRVS